MGKADAAGSLAGGAPSPYGIDLEKLNDINTNKDNEGLKAFGGVDGLAKLFQSDCHRGLDPHGTGDASIEAHQAVFGYNKFKETPPKAFLALVYENLQDPIIILLMIAALVSTVLGAAIPEERERSGWIEGVAIWIAVIAVTCVGAGNDYQKDKQFRKLNAQKDIIEIKVIRGNEQILVKSYDVVVGDMMLLDTGDKIIADCLVVDSQGLVVDEASLTGESDPIKKDRAEDPWVRSGTQVSEGSGKALVIAVGEHSEWGKTMTLVGEAGDDETPLQEKLENIAGAIGKVGMGVAIACFIALMIKWAITMKGQYKENININGPVEFFLYSITIIVVAVPEGLPLAVTISLAYSMKKMMNDNNFVRVLAACETMGGATAICSDKTGTLTENRMTVVEGWFSGHKLDHAPAPEELRPDLLTELNYNIALNSKAFLIELGNNRVDFVGNRTECALLMLMRGWHYDYKELREQSEDKLVKLYGFSSAKKMASALVRFEDKYRLYNKGAAEWVLRRCTKVYNEYGDIVDMNDQLLEELMEVVTGMAKRGLRCICLTYTDYRLNDPSRPEDFFEDSDNVDHNLVAMAIVGIKDPVRKEVPAAVATCQKAGITVRMVTGDNIHTAQHIARECGILHAEDGHMAMEGPTFRAMAATDLIPVLPNLRVLARSSPEDKLTLVRMLKQQGEVVAVTGDGTNDAPALKESDVGLAMGIAGTEVAKEAADIVILDDNFSSIVKAVLWGRSVFTNIRKFLQFQLTVNAVALVIAFIGAIVGGHEPLTVLQLLWVNLIMDTMGALALATENPNPELLNQKPYGRTESLITRTMWKHIIVQALYQLFWLFMCLYGLPKLIESYSIVDANDFYAGNDAAHRGDTYEKCPDILKDKWTSDGVVQTNDIIVSDSMITSVCNMMAYCGYPQDANSGYIGCVLPGAGNTTAYLTTPLPGVYSGRTGEECDDACGMVCGDNECDTYTVLKSAQKVMKKALTERETDDYEKPLSVLFNAFIMCQIFNEINARRINDEYNIFSGIFHSPIFMSVIVITFAFQAIIVNVPGLNRAFKVVPLDWKEWLATIAIGMGAIPLSLITRFISRTFGSWDHMSIRGKRTKNRVHSVPKSGSMRTASGNSLGHRTASGKAVVV